MKKKISLISIIIFTILSAGICFSLETTPVLCLILVICIIELPILAYKRFKPQENIPKGTCINLFVFIFFLMTLCLKLSLNSIYPTQPYTVALTSSITKANQIQELLTTKERSTERVVVTNNEGSLTAYAIKLSSSKKDYGTTLELFNSPIFDENIELTLNPKYTKNEKKQIKIFEKELKNLLLSTGYFDHADVEIKADFKKKKVESVLVYLSTKDYVDNVKVDADIRALLKSIFSKAALEEDKLVINNYNSQRTANELSRLANKEINDKNYDNALLLLEKAIVLDKSYQFQLDILKKLIKVEKELSKKPNDANLYLERGIALSFLFNEEKAIADFDKAIELNPKLAEAYRQRSLIYTSPFDPIANKEKAMENIMKAAELSDDDKMYHDVVYVYTMVKECSKAIDCFKKIKEPDFLDIMNTADCYENLEQFDKALELIEQGLKMQDSKCQEKLCKQELLDKKAKYLWKTKRYIDYFKFVIFKNIHAQSTYF